ARQSRSGSVNRNANVPSWRLNKKPRRKTEGASRKRRFVLSRQQSNAVWRKRRAGTQGSRAWENRNANVLSWRPNKKRRRKTEGASRKRRFVRSRQRSGAVWRKRRAARQSRSGCAKRNANALSKRPNKKPKRKTEGASRKRRFVRSRQRSGAVWRKRRA